MEDAVLDAPPAPAPVAPPPPRRVLPRWRRTDPEQLVVDTIARHADSVLRIARRYSTCQADAEDAYQRALEIFVKHAHRLDPGTADRWLRTVAKHEAMAVRQARRRYVGVPDEETFDAIADARHLPTIEERAERFDELTRTAEALRRLKPQEQTALMLRAQGLTYDEIAAKQEWTYTKVNRCVTEGRRALLARIEGIRSGAECERWAPILSAMADGEATAEQLLEVRPHLRNCSACRAVLGGMERATAPVAALLPAGLVAGDAVPTGSGGGLLDRLGELAVGLQERVVGAHHAVEAMGAGKVAAVAASAAAVAGGGVAVERTVADRAAAPAAAAEAVAEAPAAAPEVPTTTASAPAAAPTIAPAAVGPEFPAGEERADGSAAREEFGGGAEDEFGGGDGGSGEFAAAGDDEDAGDRADAPRGETAAAGDAGAEEREAEAAGAGADDGGSAAPSTAPPAPDFETAAQAASAPSQRTQQPAPRSSSGGREFAPSEFGG